MSIKKNYLKSRPRCKVTLSLPKQLAPNGNTVFVAGDFNQWNPEATPMKKLKNGTFQATLDLGTGREYQFRYVIDGRQWKNDDQADKWVPNRYSGEDNSVISV